MRLAKYRQPILVTFTLFTILLSLAELLIEADPSEAASCRGRAITVAAPAADLARQVSMAAPGTCFYLRAGTYSFDDVEPKDHMRFFGESRTRTIVDGSGHENAFHGTADGVVIRDMTFRNFDDDRGTPLQEQAPIRGTRALWASDAGALATNWVINNIESYGNAASGIFVGDNFTVVNSAFHDNGVTGIGGDSFVGGLIKNNTIYHNGWNRATGALMNGAGIKFTQAGSHGAPVVVSNNSIYDNSTIGIWCDVGCRGLEASGNRIHDHAGAGIAYEVSRNARINDNVLDNNAVVWSNIRGNWATGGIASAESGDVLIADNIIRGSRSGVTVRQTSRPSSFYEILFFDSIPSINLLSRDVTVRGNVVHGAVEMGVAAGGSGIDQLSESSGLRFECNTYDNPGDMDFYWLRGVQQSYSQWQASGRDAGSCTIGSAAHNQSGPTDQQGSSSVVIAMRGYTGAEDVELRVNNRRIASWSNVSTTLRRHSTTVTDEISIDTISVHFTNNGSYRAQDMNVEIDYVEIDGTRYETEAATTRSHGSWDPINGCDEGHKKSTDLHCTDSWFRFGAASGTTLAG